MDIPNYVKKIASAMKPEAEGKLDTFDHKTLLNMAIKEAFVMVRFASKQALTLDGTETTVIANMQNIMSAQSSQKNDNTPSQVSDEEKAFWSTYGALAKTIFPASVDGILMSQGMYNDLLDKPTEPSIATKTLRKYKKICIVVFVLLLFTQVFWFIGNQIITNIDKSETNIISLQQSIDVAQTHLETDVINAKNGIYPIWFSQGTKTLVTKKGISSAEVIRYAEETIQKHYQDILSPLLSVLDNNTNKLSAAYLDIRIWNLTWANPLPFLNFNVKNPFLGTTLKHIKQQIQYSSAKTVLELLSNHLLTLLYALLGSVVYIIRSTSKHIEQNDLTPTSLIRLSPRLYLGMISGVAMAWVYLSGSNGSVGQLKQDLGLLKNLGPWATAFIAGYGVEILFSFLDTIVNSFTKKKG